MGVGLLAIGSGSVAVLLSARRAALPASGSLAIPTPVDLASPIPAGSDLGIDGVASFITSNDDFYRVDTALEVPVIAAADWRLRIHGMVDREIELTFADLLDLPDHRARHHPHLRLERGRRPVRRQRPLDRRALRTVLDGPASSPAPTRSSRPRSTGCTIGTPTAVAT